MPYLSDLFFIFSLVFIASYNIPSLKQMHLFFEHFLKYPLLFLDDNSMKKDNNLNITKVQPKTVARLLINILPTSA